MDKGYWFNYFVLGLLPLLFLGYRLGKEKLAKQRKAKTILNSPPSYYGWYSVIWMLLPSIALSILAWAVDALGWLQVPLPMKAAGILGIMGLGLWLSLGRISPKLKARTLVEGSIQFILLSCSMISILTTVGIVFSIIYEALEFFKLVSFWDFITGTTWNPDTAFLESAGRGDESDSSAKAQFGSIPLFTGTFMITFIAMCVALPIGLFSAIYMSQYASLPIRRISKPLLEILAGIPTVVFGFFAALTVSPLVVKCAEYIGLQADYTNALSPGLVMGMMIIPFVSSLSDDVINSVPSAMKDGSLALGATSSQTVKFVLIPAALPGIVSSFLLAVSRAVGETMIVVMAAGLQPTLTLNPLEGMTTVTVRIVDALTGDQAFDSPETLSAFGLGLVLLVVTLMLNIVSMVVIRRFKQQYE